MINEFDYNKLHDEFQKSQPFRHCVIDNFFNEDVALQLSEEFPDYDDPNIWAVYGNPIENKKLTPHWGLFPPKTYQIFTMMNTPEFVEKIKRITGIPDLVADYGMHGGGWHIHSRGGKLNMHKDYSIHPKLGMERRINIIIYMTPDWNEEWNGGLELWSHDEEKNLPKECVTKVYNKFNRAILFDTTQNSWHGLSKVLNLPKDIFRKSYAIYYLQKPEKNISNRHKALYYPRDYQINDESVKELIKKRASDDGFSEVYKVEDL